MAEDGIFKKIGGSIDSLSDFTSSSYNSNKEVFEKLSAGRKKPLSIAGMAKNNIFEFPAFISTSVPLDFAEATCGLLELSYASFLQMAISTAPAYNMTDGDDPFAKWKTDTNNYLECSDLTYTFDACHNAIKSNDGIVFEFDLVSISDSTAQKLNEALEYEPLSEFDHYFQEVTSKSPLESTKDAAEKQFLDNIKDDKGNPNLTSHPAYTNAEKAVYDRNKAEYEDEDIDELKKAGIRSSTYYKNIEAHNKGADDAYLRSRTKWDPETGSEVPDPTRSKDYYEREKLRQDLEDHDNLMRMQKSKYYHDVHAKAPELLDESKVQKLNSLKPLTMSVQMKVIDNREHGDKGTSQTRDFIAGVKIYSRLIDAASLPEVARFPLEEMNRRTRHVRYKAGELKFFKDIVFRIKQKKQTAVDSHDPNRKWYRRLYELAHTTGDSASVAKMTKGKSIVRTRLRHRLLHFGEPLELSQRGFIPNATIIVTKDDINNINMETGIDLANNGKAVNFCKELFLMNFVIIDTDAQSIKVLTPDLHKDFEIHSLASVNKQLAMIDSSATASREIFKVLKK